jgi:hypothetical protein
MEKFRALLVRVVVAEVFLLLTLIIYALLEIAKK